MKVLISTTELGDILSVTRQAIYKWRKQGCPVVIDNTSMNGKTIRYDLDEVKDWLNSNGLERVDNEVHDHPMGAGFAQKDYK